MPTEPMVDVRRFDLARPRWGIEAIRERLPHRHELEQLTGVFEVDKPTQSVVGFRRYSADDHWVRGHVPGSPVLPGVLMIEAAAQLGTFYCAEANPGPGFWALAGVDAVRFRGAVRPGDSVVYACRMLKVRASLMRVAFQAIRIEPNGSGSVVCDGEFLGMRTEGLVTSPGTP